MGGTYGRSLHIYLNERAIRKFGVGKTISTTFNELKSAMKEYRV